MSKEGLTALAESYGLERNELHQLKVLAESYFDKLREDLLNYVGRSLRMVDLSQATSSFADFSTDPIARAASDTAGIRRSDRRRHAPR